MENSRGFTLLELLVTLVIVAVMLGVAVPGMNDLVRRNRLAAAHNEFLSSLYLLRSEAAKRNRVMTMCRMSAASPPDCDDDGPTGWEAGWSIWLDEDDNGQIDLDEVLVSTRGALADGVRLSGNGASLTHRIAFKPIGVPVGFNNGTFTVCVDEYREARQIIISTAGRIRTRKRDPDDVC